MYTCTGCYAGERIEESVEVSVSAHSASFRRLTGRSFSASSSAARLSIPNAERPLMSGEKPEDDGAGSGLAGLALGEAVVGSGCGAAENAAGEDG